jgi:hypothetical protein
MMASISLSNSTILAAAAAGSGMAAMAVGLVLERF